ERRAGLVLVDRGHPALGARRARGGAAVEHGLAEAAGAIDLAEQAAGVVADAGPGRRIHGVHDPREPPAIEVGERLLGGQRVRRVVGLDLGEQAFGVVDELLLVTGRARAAVVAPLGALEPA